MPWYLGPLKKKKKKKPLRKALFSESSSERRQSGYTAFQQAVKQMVSLQTAVVYNQASNTACYTYERRTEQGEVANQRARPGRYGGHRTSKKVTFWMLPKGINNVTGSS